MSVTRDCEQCGEKFTAHREHARFCGDTCRQAWNRAHPGGTRDRAGPPDTRDKPPRQRNWNGKSNDKRMRELRARKPYEAYNDLTNFQARLAQMCSVLNIWNPEGLDLDEVILWRVSDIHDDLVTLAEWTDRTLSSVQGWLGDRDVREKIAKLRNTTGRTPEEAATALRLAAKLERKLETRLGSGDPVTRDRQESS